MGYWHLAGVAPLIAELSDPELRLASVIGWRVHDDRTTWILSTRGEAPGALGVRVGRHVRFRPEDLEAWLDQQSSREVPRGRW